MANETLTPLQKAACEAIWRRMTERQEPVGYVHVDPKEDRAKCKLSRQVAILPKEFLQNIVLPEILQYGGLPGGYTQRWAYETICMPRQESPPPLPENLEAPEIFRKDPPQPPLDTKIPEPVAGPASPKADEHTRS